MADNGPSDARRKEMTDFGIKGKDLQNMVHGFMSQAKGADKAPEKPAEKKPAPKDRYKAGPTINGGKMPANGGY